MDKQNPEVYMLLHCIFHQWSLCGKTLDYEQVSKAVVSVVNFIRSHGFNHCRMSLLEIGAEFG